MTQLTKNSANDKTNAQTNPLRKKFRLGLIINPLAGMGGTVGLKGSDELTSIQQAESLGAIAQANQRAKVALEQFLPFAADVDIFTVSDQMGENLCQSLGFSYQVVYQTSSNTTNAQDTIDAATLMSDMALDLILFAGGDGTARNICEAVTDNTTVLGIPAGCKIHSGVYAITPKAAGRIVHMLIAGELVSVQEADVMDIDEAQFRQGVVRAKRFGELQIPSELRYVQAVKMGGKESDELVLQDIAASVIDEMESEETYIMGSGSTVAFIMEELDIKNTLLGVDVIKDHQLIATDVTTNQLLPLLEHKPVKLVITLIGGQGHIFGRGNQQLSPEVIRTIGKENIVVVATKRKLQALAGRPLIADTGDIELDKMLAGHIKVTTGYKDQVFYPVGYEEI
ncbi:ATP-NAD kinase family protein [Psychrosphaera sp. 1_MG-2023]|uniref:ATP-NAD kinase family protein n=1 Tax=Psychrosphaera sp. 1_MG-2023 TaxID=3062643 RepID=UPI0026E1687C|nr:ATP-NAD kinase family protein [Psychrosphaera sp. 1_MG-2023]MDO6719520.1 ATP-NAD kinase family protein [Psychrosphaera sp. 1_MG-2023]